MALELRLACTGCGADVTDGKRGQDWENYADLMVACSGCLAAAGWAPRLVAPAMTEEKP